MDAFIIKLFNMSLAAVWLILAAVALRFILKKAPKNITLILWALVGFRLVCPFSFESVMSLIPSEEAIPSNIAFVSSPSVNTGISAVDELINPAVSQFAEVPYTIGYSPVDMAVRIFIAVWCCGAAVMIAYSLISFLFLKRKVKVSLRYEDNIYLCDNIKTPFVLGVFKPKIYLPSDICQEQLSCVIAHEKAHIKRLDHITKSIGFAVLCIHWFNPFVWLSYNLFCKDIEYACDEKVVKDMENDAKKQYSETLLSLSMPRHALSACPLAFGETGVKGRIKSVINYKKPALWIIIVSVIAVAAVAVGFMTKPADKEIDGYHYIDKYYFDYVIGEDRANSESADISFRIGEDMVLTKFFGTGTGNSEVLGTLYENNANDYEIGLVLDTLPVMYRNSTIDKVWAADFFLSDKYIFIRFRNGDFIGAYLPTDSNGNYYVMNSFRLKRNPDVKVEYVTEYMDEGNLYIPGTTTNDKVGFGIIEMNLSGAPYLVGKIENNTGDSLYYGTAYGVYRIENGEKIDCNTYEDRVWYTVLCMAGEETVTRKFSLAGYDLSVPGLYSVEFSFGVGEGNDTDEFLASVEFRVEESVTGNEVLTSAPAVPDSTTVVAEATTTAVIISESTTTVIIDSDESKNTFNAKVLEVNDNNILVEPFDGEDERKSASRIYVSTDLKSGSTLPEIKKGDYVTIAYDGMIQETYPAQITTVYSIVLHERGR